MASIELSVEVIAFEVVVNGAFVLFGDVEYEWSQPCVAVVAVLSPNGGASDSYNYARSCFADFDGGGVHGGNCGFLVSW